MDVSAHQEEDPLTDAESLHIWGVFSRGLDPDDNSHAKKTHPRCHGLSPFPSGLVPCNCGCKFCRQKSGT